MAALSFRRVNTLLLVLIISLNAYVVAAPLLPALLFAIHDRGGVVAQQLQQKINQPSSPSTPVTQVNQLIIPSMVLDETIHEGSVADTYSVLKQGVWRWPNGSTPDKGGNTTFIGHRFTYTNPRGVFYYLNKVQIGDTIGVIWNNVHYVYKVTTIATVPPDQTQIEAPTTDARLTIFTCTPLWLPKDRLVVVAERVTS